MADTSEQFVIEVLRQTIGAQFTDTDRGTSGGEPGMPDGLFDLPTGETGALEVTVIADQSTMQLEGEVRARAGGQGRWEIPGVESFWEVRLMRVPVDLDQLRSALEIALPLAEAIGAIDVMFEGETQRWNRELTWLRDVTQCSLISTERAGVTIIPEQTQTFWIPDRFEGIAAWWEENSRGAHLAGKIAKLRRSLRSELHLALVLHETATSPDLGYLLAMTDQMPAPEESLDTDLHVWFFPRWDVPVLRWEPGTGWRRTALPK